MPPIIQSGIRRARQANSCKIINDENGISAFNEFAVSIQLNKKISFRGIYATFPKIPFEIHAPKDNTALQNLEINQTIASLGLCIRKYPIFTKLNNREIKNDTTPNLC